MYWLATFLRYVIPYGMPFAISDSFQFIILAVTFTISIVLVTYLFELTSLDTCEIMGVNITSPIWRRQSTRLRIILESGAVNTYVYTLVQLGVIMFLLLIIAYLCCLLSAYRHRDTRRLFIITVFILYGFMEQSFINPFINFSWLFIADMVWGRKDNNETWNCQTV